MAFIYKRFDRFEASVDMSCCRVSVGCGGRSVRVHQCGNKKKVER